MFDGVTAGEPYRPDRADELWRTRGAADRDNGRRSAGQRYRASTLGSGAPAAAGPPWRGPLRGSTGTGIA